MNKDIIMKYINDDNKEMVSLVNIDNFIKCMAAVTSHTFGEIVSSETMSENVAKYLNTWANNKKWLFEGLYEHKLTIDTTFERNKEASVWANEFDALRNKPGYELYYPYIKFIEAHTPIFYDGLREGYTSFNQYCPYDRLYGQKLLPDSLINQFDRAKDLKLTTIASKYLNLPKNLVDELGRMFDSNKDKCNFTLSIDPVDILTCSVSPYNWTSCYSISPEHRGSHCDGGVAAMVDTSSQIIIGWKDQGKFKMEELELKNFKFKLFRAWLNTNENFQVIHIASAYPYRDEEHTKAIREKVEEIICDKFGYTNLWSKTKSNWCHISRFLKYGYEEFSERNILVNNALKEAYENNENTACTIIDVYDEPIWLIENGEIVLGSDENYVDEDGFDDWWDDHSNVDWDDYWLDDEQEEHDDEAYWDAREEERDEMWDEYVNFESNEVSCRYGIGYDVDCPVAIDGAIGEEDVRYLYVDNCGMLEWN